MSFQELGSSGEFVAAVAMVAKLIYIPLRLRLRVRMNSRVAVSNIENQLHLRVCERRLSIQQNPAFSGFLARDWVKEKFTLSERTQTAQYITILVIDERKTFLQNKLGFVSKALLENRIIRLSNRIICSDIAKSVWATYKNMVETDFADYFERRIFPEGLEESIEKSHPQFKKNNQEDTDLQLRRMRFT